MFATSKSNSISVSFGADRLAATKKLLHKFLQFQLGSSDRAVIEAEVVTEVIAIPKEEVLPVPQMLYSILGIYSWRSEMLWIIDLENLLGYPPPLELSHGEGNDALTVMVVQIDGQSLGFVVPKVHDLIEYDREEVLQPLIELFSQDIVGFLKGYFTDINNEIVMLINAEEIFQLFAL